MCLKNDYYKYFCILANKRKYIVVGKYIDNTTEIEMKCFKNGHTFFITPALFKFGGCCKQCYPSQIKTENIKIEVENY
jgi:hypothetical protein